MLEEKKEQVIIENKTQVDSLPKNDSRKYPKHFIAWQYAKELWGDHRFWKQLTVFKGGVGIIAAGVLLVPTILSMPFILAASAVALVGVLTTAAVFSVGYGLHGLFGTCRDTKMKIKGKFNASASNNVECVDDESQDIPLSETRIAFQDMLKKKWPIKQISNTKLVKNIGDSKQWQKFAEFMNKSDNLLDTLTVKNSVASVAIFGSILLTTQAVLLPLIMPIVIVSYSVASVGLAMYMFYEGGKGIFSSFKNKRRKTTKAINEKVIDLKLKEPSIEKPKKQKKLNFKFWASKPKTEAKKALPVPANENKPVALMKNKSNAHKR